MRDAALAHLLAIKVDAAKNKRFIVSAEDLWIREYAQLIAEQYRPKGFEVVTKESARGSSYQLKLRNDEAKTVLGIQFRPIKQAGIDMIESMIKAGKISPTQNPWLNIETAPANVRSSHAFSSMLQFDTSCSNE